MDILFDEKENLTLGSINSQNNEIEPNTIISKFLDEIALEIDNVYYSKTKPSAKIIGYVKKQD